jgi:hypothetical protein
MALEVLIPSIPIFDGALGRLDLPLVSPELFAGDFGAVVFAIILFLGGYSVDK